MLPELSSFDPDVKGESRNNKNLHPIIRGIFVQKYCPQNSISISMKVFCKCVKTINILITENIIYHSTNQDLKQICLAETVHTFRTETARHGPFKINTGQQ